VKIPFNKPPLVGSELAYITEALKSGKLSGDGLFSEKCKRWFETRLSPSKVLLTPNCTQALEMAAMLLDIKAGDEVIMPSYTFVSTANAFVIRGARVKFVDVKKETMNLDVSLIEAAISSSTKAIVVVHYAGVSCDMDKVSDLARKHDLYVVEDAAQGMMSTYNGKALGTIGDLGAYSFHETKNYTSGGEGGLLLINNPIFFERAEIIREKGTDRSKFFRGAVDKYTWQDIGSSYLPSELQAAYLFSQLENVDRINENRLKTWSCYYKAFEVECSLGLVERPNIPLGCEHNGHLFYLLLRSKEERADFISFMKSQGIMSVFHYVPLHSSPAGRRFGSFSGDDVYTSSCSERLVRLPLYFGIQDDELAHVVDSAKHYLSTLR
jgi:dTDP-4-amino-4,6-dideoxygalactose transaminase